MEFYLKHNKQEEEMNNLLLPQAWNETMSNLTYFPVVVKSLEKIHDTTWSMKENIHDNYEMVYIKKGTATFYISGEGVELSPHNIVIIKPQQWHKFAVKSMSCEFIVLSFTFSKNSEDDKAASLSELSGLEDYIDDIRDLKKSPYVTLNPGPKNEILSILKKIMNEREKERPWNDFLIYLLLLEMFVYISRTIKLEMESDTRYRSMNLTESMYAARDFIVQNYNKDISLGDIARYVYLSESYFAHSFKDVFGTSPKNYILKLRIETAKDILRKTDMKVSDIAASVGFLSQQRFNDIFKKMESVTPLKYRKEYKESMVNKVTE